MSTCSTRRYVFLLNRKTCLRVQQEDMSSCSTRTHVCYIVGTLLEGCWNTVGTLLECCWNLVGTQLERCWNVVVIVLTLLVRYWDAIKGKQHRETFYDSLTRLVLEGFLLNNLKVSGKGPAPQVVPLAPPGGSGQRFPRPREPGSASLRC